MSRLIRPSSHINTRLSDPRSTGAGSAARPTDLAALRGTLKSEQAPHGPTYRSPSK